MRYSIMGSVDKRILFVLVILLIPLASASNNLCDSVIDVGTNCTMATPSLYCTQYNYTIYNTTNNSNSIVVMANLTNLENNIYYFNFSMPQGDYIVELCDQSTREISVRTEDKMILLGLILAPLLFGLVFAISGFALDKKYEALKVMAMLVSIVCFWSSMHFGVVMVNSFIQNDDLSNTISTTIMVTGYLMITVLASFLIIWIIDMFNHLREKKAREEDEG